MPKKRGICAGIAVGVEGIDRIVLRGYVDHVVDAFARDADIGQVQGLGIHVTVDRIREQLSELASVYVERCENSFGNIGPTSGVVVVLGGALALPTLTGLAKPRIVENRTIQEMVEEKMMNQPGRNFR